MWISFLAPLRLCVKYSRFESRVHAASPAGFLDQPFYGWDHYREMMIQPVSTGLHQPLMQKAIWISTLKRAKDVSACLPSAQSAGLRTLRESRLKTAKTNPRGPDY
jgi:hypothetical protein